MAPLRFELRTSIGITPHDVSSQSAVSVSQPKTLRYGTRAHNQAMLRGLAVAELGMLFKDYAYFLFNVALNNVISAT